VLTLTILAAICAVQGLAIGAAWLLRARETTLHTKLPYLLSIAVGVLVATALLHLIPESVEALGNGQKTWAIIGATLFTLFTVERLVFAMARPAAEPRRAEPDRAGSAHPKPPVSHAHAHAHAASLRPVNLVVASSLHSLVDGTAIATAFVISPRLGLLTAFAVALHEVPHRLGDLAVLLHFGIAPARAMRFIILVALPSIVGAYVVILVGSAKAGLFLWLLPVSAGSFLYIAGVNLLPELEMSIELRPALIQLACVAAGVLLVFAVTGLHAG
jgi:zinc and cadmium transporter